MYHILHIKKVSLPGDVHQRYLVDKVTGAFVPSISPIKDLKLLFGFIANEKEYFIVVRHGSPCHFLPLFVLPSHKVYKVSREDWHVLKYVPLYMACSKPVLDAMYCTDGLSNMSDVLTFLHGFGVDSPSSTPSLGKRWCLVSNDSAIF